MSRPAAIAVAALTLLAASAIGQAPAAAPPKAAPANAPARRAPLSLSETQQLVKAYATTETWAMRALVLLSLGADFHPAGAEVVLAALKDKDVRLRAFAVELLRRMDEAAAPCVATAPLVAELVAQSKHKNPLLRERVLAALAKLAPEAGCKDGAAWTKWWSERSAVWAPKEWTAPAAAARGAGGTVAGRVVERAFDLRDAGLEVVFVLDTTGSMQIAIDAARDAIDEISTLLAGITPKLELGLVHYKDFGDMGDGAQLLVPLTKDHKQVREKLAKLVANGGGDAPERVEKGIEVALGKETGWSKNANRMLLVIGDAPPHPEDEAELLELVRRAHDDPAAVRGKKAAAVTGKPGGKDEPRPFVTSALATSQAAKPSFDKIAAAGGGTSVLVDLGPPKRGAGGLLPPEPKPAGAPRSRSGAQQVAEHTLLLAFGQGYAAELRVFVDTFFEYHDAGLF